ncbi:hypothetical protein H0E87_021437 [Populus deltoides]|uniref:RING-type E3 ubiquitin transferase n=1 Tax=Populus deltoides TaxID=3696 RepID=A0A8T2XFE0_POPDE|nr:hypothetical protein H0E87_021437 [Populus deltoides]
MPVFAESSSSTPAAIADQIKLRKPRSQQELQPISAETDPNPHASKSSKSNTIISSLFHSHFSTTPPDQSKKKGATFRGLGCTAGAAQQVSVPAVIRSSADWEGKKVKKKKGHPKRKKESLKLCSDNNNTSNSNGDVNGDGNFANCMVMQDVWCGPGMGFSGADAVVGSVDCVVARRNVSIGRGKIDGGEKINQRERERERERDRERERERPCIVRRAAVNPETLSFLDTDPAFITSRPEPEVFGTRYYRHIRHPSPDGLAEIMMLQNSFIVGGRMDRFSNWRLDIDHMTYEQLLDLGDRIGYVNTGLKEDEISRCVKKINPSFIKELSSHLPMVLEKKCSICQDDYEEDGEVGKLDCGHGFHIQCIKQWLGQKNTCPVCKTEPVGRG